MAITTAIYSKEVSMRINTSRILLVGKCLIGSTELRSFLESLGARLHFSETLAGAASLVRRRRFDVVLSQAQLPEGSARRLVRNLLTSSASFILSFRAESTYLWLPAIWKGQHCWGTSALRPSEFRAKLRELLAEPHPPDSGSWRAPTKNASQTAAISCCATTKRRVSVSARESGRSNVSQSTYQMTTGSPGERHHFRIEEATAARQIRRRRRFKQEQTS